MTVPYAAELRVAVEAAESAARLLAEAHGRGPRRIDRKDGQIDLVTEVDRACEDAIRQVLAARTPDVPILGEEEGGAWEAATRWVIDPLDGTVNFVHGFPWFAVSIGLEVDGVPVVGVVLDPVRQRRHEATRGGGARVDGAPIRVSDTRVLNDALVATGFPYDRRSRLDALLTKVRVTLQVCRGLRRAGAASLDLALVAEGRLDVYFEASLRPWDLCAGHVLVEEAGGRISNHDGSLPLDPRWPAPLVSNGPLHEAMVQVLTG